MLDGGLKRCRRLSGARRLRRRRLSLTAVKDHTLISSSKDLIRAIDSTTGSTVTTRNVCSLPSCPLMETYSPGKKRMCAEFVADLIVVVFIGIIVEHPAGVLGATGLVDRRTDLVLLACPKSPTPAVVAILLPEQ